MRLKRQHAVEHMNIWAHEEQTRCESSFLVGFHLKVLDLELLADSEHAYLLMSEGSTSTHRLQNYVCNQKSG